MDPLEIEIQVYKDQLQTLSSMGNSDELVTLRNNIQELIQLTEQNLLEKKKQALLALVEESSDEKSHKDPEPEVNNVEAEANHDLIGQKFQAPFVSKVLGKGARSYHNAVIFCHDDSNDQIVKVVFCNPVELAMVPCPFFLEGKCKFADEKCRYSHGEAVLPKDLKPFIQPDYSILRQGKWAQINKKFHYKNFIWSLESHQKI